MKYENRDWELSMKDLLFALLYQWKKIILAAIVLAIVLGGMMGVKTLRSATAIQTMAAEQEVSYQNELQEYEKEVWVLEQRIAFYENAIETQKEYLAESLLMQLDSRNVYKAEVTVYIDSDYQIMPEVTYQNTDKTDLIASVYVDLLSGTKTLNEVAAEIGMQTKYLQELTLVESSMGSLVSISAYSGSQEEAMEIAELLLNRLYEAQPVISETVGAHSIHELNNSVGLCVDDYVGNRQGTEEDRLLDYETDLAAKNDELKTLKADKPQAEAISQSGVFGTAVKWAIVGAFLGGFLVVAVVAVAFVLKNSVYSGRELKSRLNVKVLGSVVAQRKKPFDLFTCWLRKKEGRLVENSNENLELLAANIHNYSEGVSNILIAGEVAGEEIQNLARQLQHKLGDKRVLACGSLLRDAATLRALAECDGVVLMETCDKTKYGDMVMEIESLADAKKKLIGCILVE